MIKVTLKNTGPDPIIDLAYSRQADFDVSCPTGCFTDEFQVLVPDVVPSVLGGPATVVRAKDIAGGSEVFGLAGIAPDSITFANFPPNGPFNPKPIPAPVPYGVPQNIDGIGANYFDLGVLNPGESVTFNIAYAAGVDDAGLQDALSSFSDCENATYDPATRILDIPVVEVPATGTCYQVDLKRRTPPSWEFDLQGATIIPCP